MTEINISNNTLYVPTTIYEFTDIELIRNFCDNFLFQFQNILFFCAILYLIFVFLPKKDIFKKLEIVLYNFYGIVFFYLSAILISNYTPDFDYNIIRYIIYIIISIFIYIYYKKNKQKLHGWLKTIEK